MEGLIVLVGIVLFMGMVMAAVLAPLACAKAHNNTLANNALKERVEHLANQLNDLRARFNVLQREAAEAAPRDIEQLQPQAQPAPEPDLEPELKSESEIESPLEFEDAPTKENDDAAPLGVAVPDRKPSVSDPPAPAPQEEEPAAEPNTLERLRAAREMLEPPQSLPGEDEVATPEQHIQEKPSAPTADERPEPPNPQSVYTERIEEEPIRRLTIEEVLAGKVFVWIGAIALVLTAAFLLKLGFDSGIITEQVRVIAAGVFGVALWAVGEWARTRVSLIAQALCGSGVAVLYGTIVAGQHYELLGPGNTIAFGLMGLVTAAAVVLSLRHGPAVAILGMLGGFMMPPLLVENVSPTLGMVLYLIAIEVGVLAVTGKRGWFGISLMTLIFSVVWSIGYTLIGDSPGERTLTALLVLGTAGAYLVHTARVHRDPESDRLTRLRALALSIAATCSAIAIVALLVVQGGYTTQDLSTLGLVAAGTLVLARLDARQIAMPFIAMGIGLLVLLANARTVSPGLQLDSMITTAAAFGGLFMLGGYLCLWGSSQHRAFTVLSAIAGPSFLGIIMYASQGTYDLLESGWPYTLMLAGVYAVGVIPVIRQRRAANDWSIGLYAVLSFALVCGALTQAMDHPRLAVCLALLSAVAALIDLRLFIRPLRMAACTVAGISALLLVVPGPFDMTIQGVVVFNTLLPMYLLPAIAFGVMAWCASRAGSAPTAGGMTYLCCGMLGVMLVVLTRQAYHPLDFAHQGFALYEWATLSCVLLLAAMLAHLVADRFELDALRECVVVCTGLGAGIGLIAGLVASNPLFYSDTTGGTELALGLFALYLVPAVLMWLWARRKALDNQPQLVGSLRGTSITLLAIFAGLQIRNGFNAEDLHNTSPGMYEYLTYAVVWVLLGGFIQRLNRTNLQSTVTRIAGRIIFGIGLATTLIGSVVVFNPLLDPDAVGGWGLAGRLALLYVLPAVLLWLWSRGKTLADQPKLVSALRATSILFITIFVGQIIRNAFQAEDLHAERFLMYEGIAYAMAGMLIGVFIQWYNNLRLHCTTTQTAGQIIFGIGLATLVVASVVVFNPLLSADVAGGWGLSGRMAALYVLPAIFMWMWSLGKTLADQQPLIRTLRVVSILFITMFVGLQVRNAFHADDLRALTVGMFECATYALAWMLLGVSIVWVNRDRLQCVVTRIAGQIIFVMGLATSLIGSAIILNPLWTDASVGTAIVFNGLWYLYGPTIVVLALLARYTRSKGIRNAAKLAGFTAIGLSFMLLSLLVRQGFSGDGVLLLNQSLDSGERYAYSLAWVLFGGGLLVAGVFTRLDTLRYGSLAVLLLAVGKVFLIDTANLENLYRVFSFFGLGVTLIALGYLYQRLVFRRPNTTTGAHSA